MKFSRIKYIKQINDYLIKNKNRIKSVDLDYSKFRPIQFSSDGSCILEPISDEIITIKLKPKNRRYD